MTIERAKQVIADALRGARSPIVCWSGGKDSQLLLRLVAERRPDIPILYFRSADPVRRKWPEQFIADSGLTAYSWEPRDRYVLPGPSGMLLVEEYSFGHMTVPIVSEISKGDRCCIDVLKGTLLPYVSYPFDVTFVGVKDCDEHPILGKSYWQADGDGCFAPLRHMSDEEVWQAIREMEIPVEEAVYDGSVPDGPSLCTGCLETTGDVFCPREQKVIPGYVWDSQARVSEFRTRYQIGG